MSTDPITAALDAFSALSTLVGKALPSDEERLERLKINHPWLYARALKRAEKKKRELLKQKLLALEDAAKFANQHNIRPETLASYLWGDTTKAEILRQFSEKK